MSDLGTRIMAAGLVDDGIAVEALEDRLRGLQQLLTDNKPICPFCHHAMSPKAYDGYYEKFSYWACNCETLPDSERWFGSYSS